MTHWDDFPLPRIDATLDLLADSTLFTTLDLALGYWQVELDSADKEKQLSLLRRATLNLM